MSTKCAVFHFQEILLIFVSHPEEKMAYNSFWLHPNKERFYFWCIVMTGCPYFSWLFLYFVKFIFEQTRTNLNCITFKWKFILHYYHLFFFFWLNGLYSSNVQCGVYSIQNNLIFVWSKFSFKNIFSRQAEKKFVSANKNVISIMHNMPNPVYAEHISKPKKGKKNGKSGKCCFHVAVNWKVMNSTLLHFLYVLISNLWTL